MTNLTPYAQRRIDADFERVFTQHSAGFSPEMQSIVTAPPAVVLHHFKFYQQTVSSETILRRRNELARGFATALRTNQWAPNESLAASPIMDWLLGLRTGKNSGLYSHHLRALVLLACNKLVLPKNKKDAWKKAVAGRPISCPKDIAQQSANALPRPILRDAHTHG